MIGRPHSEHGPVPVGSTGAVRGSDLAGLRYDLIHPEILRALAEVYAEGAAKYGECNWERGMPAADLLGHAIAHIFAFLDGSPSGEPDLEHALWGVGAALVSARRWPALNGDLRTMQTLRLAAGAVGQGETMRVEGGVPTEPEQRLRDRLRDLEALSCACPPAGTEPDRG